MAFVFHDLEWPDLPKKQVKSLAEDQAEEQSEES